MAKAFAFQIYHRGRLVAEAPLVVHDVDAAIEAVEQIVCGDPQCRGQAADVLSCLLSVRYFRDNPSAAPGTYTGFCMTYQDTRAVQPTGPADVSVTGGAVDRVANLDVTSEAPRGREFI